MRGMRTVTPIVVRRPLQILGCCGLCKLRNEAACWQVVKLVPSDIRRTGRGSVNPCAPHRRNTIPKRQTRSFVYRPLIITRSMWDRSQVILMSIEGALFIRPTTAMSVVISVRCELTTLPLLSPRTTCHASQSHPCGPLKLNPPTPSDPSGLRSFTPRSMPPKFAAALICGNERIAELTISIMSIVENRIWGGSPWQ